MSDERDTAHDKTDGWNKWNRSEATYFSGLEVRNIRCFSDPAERLSLVGANGLPARWTILLGNNGTGKTTLLQILAAFENIQPGQSRAFTPGFLESHRLESGFARRGTKVGTASVGLWSGGDFLSGSRTGRSEISSITFSEATIAQDGAQLTTSRTPLCFGYGASRHLTASTLTTQELSDSCASLFSDSADLINAEEWLLRLDYSASKPSEVQGLLRAQYEQVVQLLRDVLPDVDAMRVTDPSRDDRSPRVEFKTPDGWVPLLGLGHGYRTLIAWMVDLTARLVGNFPEHPDPLQAPIVLLVDEIDLHLHPRWQRQLVSYLSSVFPNAQFIVTAHSPLVVQGAAGANLAVLRRADDHVVIDNNAQAVRGWRVDQILTSDLFDVPTARPPELDPLLARRKAILSQSSISDENRIELERIESEIGSLPTEPIDADARQMLKLAEETEVVLRKYGG